MILRRPAILLASLLTFNTTVLAATVAKVGDVTISDQEVEQLLKSNPTLAQSPQGRQLAVDILVSQELLYQQARAQHLETDAEVKKAIDAATRQILINASQMRYLREHPVSDAAVRERYNQIINTMPKDQQEYRIRHIMVKTREEADDIQKQLKKGKSFSDLATRSLDVDTARQGGELGWIMPSFLVSEIRVEVEKMKPGQTSAPIQTAQGWDIVQVMDQRRAQTPSFEAVKEQLRAQLQQAALQQYVQELRNKGNVVVTQPQSGTAPTGTGRASGVTPSPPPRATFPGGREN